MLFDLDERLPPGLRLAPTLIDRAEEAALLDLVRDLPLRPARYHGYLAQRRVFGWRAGSAGDPSMANLPPPLVALRDRLAAWAGVDAQEFEHAMVAEYPPGAPLGWHRDAPHHELIAGVSLASAARMRFRPWPYGASEDGAVAAAASTPGPLVAVTLAPRSAYVIAGPARWGWQHSLAPVEALRYSITLRTARACPSPRTRDRRD